MMKKKMKTTRTKFADILGALAALCLAPLFCLGQDYKEPDFSRALFDRSQLKIGPEEQGRLVESLVALAKLEDIDPSVKAKALAFAHTIAPGQWPVIETNFRLRHGQGFGLSSLISRDAVSTELTRLLATVKAADKSVGFRASAVMDEIVSGMSPYQVFNELGAKNSPRLEPAPPEPFARKDAAIGGVFLSDAEIPESRSSIEMNLRFASEAMKSTVVQASVTPTGEAASSIDILEGVLAPELNSALREMVKMFALRNLAVPRGNRIEVSFDHPYSTADGPTAVLACALLVDALVNDWDLDPKFAPAGDLNADGSVQPIYDIRERVLAAQQREASNSVDLLAIPEKSAARLGDILLTDGVEPLIKTQLFVVKTFDEAKALAAAPANRDPKIQQSIELFAEVQKALDRPSPAGYLANAQVRERLSKVLELNPNHASARFLLLKGARRNPPQLTLQGSLNSILHAYVFLDKGKSPKFDSLPKALSYLGQNRKILDPKSVPWLQSIVSYEGVLRKIPPSLRGSQRSELSKQLSLAGNRVELEYQKLMSNPEAREVLMR